jgi:hypothetical protein
VVISTVTLLAWRAETAKDAESSQSMDLGQPDAHFIPRGSLRWKKLYRLCGAVERENGRI